MILISLKHVENIGCLAATRRPIALGLPPSGPCLGATSWLFRQGSLAFQAASTTSFSSSWPLGGGTGCALAFLRMVGGPKVSPWHHWKMLRIKHAVSPVPGRYQHPGCKSARLLNTLASWCGYLFKSEAPLQLPLPKTWQLQTPSSGQATSSSHS